MCAVSGLEREVVELSLFLLKSVVRMSEDVVGRNKDMSCSLVSPSTS